jgi:L,D-transpeptidase YcbB
MRRLFILVIMMALTSMPTSLSASAITSSKDSAPIKAALASATSPESDLWDWSRWRESLSALYLRRAHAPQWFAHDRLTPSGMALLDELPKLERRGLIAADYGGERLAQMIRGASRAGGNIDRELLAGIDVALSVSAARLASDLHRGRVDPTSIGYDLDVVKDAIDIPLAVTALATTTDVGRTLDSFEPRLAQYARLKSALARYLELPRDPELTRLPTLPKTSLVAGDEYTGAPTLRRLLVAVGDLPETAGSTESRGAVFDAALVAALRRFQARHGLDADGVLGKSTFRALSVPLSMRAQQIVLSLERMRWLPPRMESPPIIVNVPQFRLFAFRNTEDGARDILQMDVIVGEAFEGRQTPVFASDMRYVVLNPYWDVPSSIVVRELLPQIESDLQWIARNGFEIVRGPGDDAAIVPATAANLRLLAAGKLRLRQKPGPGNALGRVKFIVPNRHNVYLHDTPARALFARTSRAFSHGCIRVADPMALLAHVLRSEPNWDEARIAAALRKSTPVRVPLTRPIRVFILYGTALVTEDGAIRFFGDIYDQDEGLIRLLQSRRGTGMGSTSRPNQ